jgi:hypothetical protein
VEPAPDPDLPQTLDAGLPDARYSEVLSDIKARVDAARVRALRAANAELMGVYWHIGRHIAEQQDAAPVKRGHTAPKIIERLSVDLRAAYPDATGFSPRNLRYMRDFSRTWTEEAMWQRGVATLPWGHIIELLGIHDPETRDWYGERAGEWTRPVLQHHIANGLHLSQGAASSNFKRTLLPGDAEAAQALTLRGIASPIAVARWKTGSEMTITEEPTVSPGMQAELREMREVEAELTAFATRQIAAIEEGTADLDKDATSDRADPTSG